MTDATVEQQGASKRRGEHPEVPQAAESSSSSSGSETSADTEMGFDVCPSLHENSEAKGRCEGGQQLLTRRNGISIKLIVETKADNWLSTRNRCC